MLKKQKISQNTYATNQTIFGVIAGISALSILITGIALSININEYGFGLVKSGTAVIVWIAASAVAIAAIGTALIITAYISNTTLEIQEDIDKKSAIDRSSVAYRDCDCPKCGEKLSGLFCLECRTVFKDATKAYNDSTIFVSFFKKIKNALGKFAIIKLVSLVVITALAIILLVNKPWNYLTHRDNVAKVDLDMTKEEVADILGSPDTVSSNEKVWYYFDGQFAKKYEDYQLVLDGESLAAAVEAYQDIEGTEYTLTMITFVNDKVAKVLYDEEHIYSEVSHYKTNSELESVSIDGDIIGLRNNLNSDFTLLTEIYNCEYHASLSGESFIKSKLLNYSPSVDYELSNNEDKISIEWEDEMFSYSISEDIVLNVLDDSYTYLIGEGVETVLESYFTPVKDIVQKLYISSSVTDFSPTAISSLTALKEITVSPNNFVFSVIDNSLYKSRSEIYWVSPDISGYVRIPNGVTSIGMEFSGRDKITGIFIPASVTGISDNAFRGCSALRSIEVDQNNKLFVSKTGILYIQTAATEIMIKCVPENIAGDVVIMDGISFLDGSFVGKSEITSICVPESVRIISPGAFAGCSSLESITIPHLGEYSSEPHVLGGLFGTTAYESSVAVKQVDANPIFASSYQTYYFPKNLTKVTVTGGEIPYGAFSNCSQLTEIVLENIEIIEPYAFYNCSSLKKFSIPDSVTSIDSTAFEGCDNLDFN